MLNSYLTKIMATTPLYAHLTVPSVVGKAVCCGALFYLFSGPLALTHG